MALKEPEVKHIWCFGPELRIHLVPKSGQHAMMKHGMDQNHPVFNRAIVKRCAADKEDGDHFRVMCVRHPLDRLVSCWKFFTEERKWSINKGDMKNWGVTKNMHFEDFCKHYIGHYMENMHTQPQVDFKGEHEINLLFPIEKLDLAWSALHDLFPEYTNPEVKRTHGSGRGPWKDYVYPSLEKKLMKVLGEDLDLYNEALSR